MKSQHISSRLSLVNPENFELTLRRMLEPSAEEKMREALAVVMEQIEDSDSYEKRLARQNEHERIVLENKKKRLERRIAKIQELKQKAVGPLMGGLVLALLIWVTILAVTAGGGVFVSNSIQAAIERDKETLKANSSTGLTIKELDEDFNLGQRMGMPGGGKDADGNYKKIDDRYIAPDYFLEIVAWTPELDSCATTSKLFTNNEIPGCEAAGVLELEKIDSEVTMTCAFLQLGNENARNETATEEAQQAWGRNARFITEKEALVDPVFWTARDEKSMDNVTMLYCQAFNQADKDEAFDMAFTVGQVGIRIDNKFYMTGGLVSWFEDDESYAPRRVWEGHGPPER